MAESIVSRERLLEMFFYAPEAGDLVRKISTSSNARAGDVAGTVSSTTGYRQVNIDGKFYGAHRLVWLYHYGVWPSDQIDHINRDRTDNRIENLREATDAQNRRNMSRRHDNTSGHVGVSWCSRTKKWVAQIQHTGKNIFLGRCREKEDAIAARKAGELKYWGAYRAE